MTTDAAPVKIPAGTAFVAYYVQDIIEARGTSNP
jgi:hypothetical protein